MRLSYIIQAFRMIMLEILRSRIVLILFFLLPVVFYLVTWFTLSSAPFPFILGSVAEKPALMVAQEALGIVFIGLAANGLIASFLALNIMQKNTAAKKRLVLCGYSSYEISTASMLAVLFSMLMISLFVSLLGLLFIKPEHYFGVLAGFMACAWVYGGYGLLIGTIVRRELEGILFIVLLANLDIGWLQNPIYYASAQSKELIEWLPGFFPSQTTIAAAFSDYPLAAPVLNSILYGCVLVILSLLMFHLKIKVSKRK